MEQLLAGKPATVATVAPLLQVDALIPLGMAANAVRHRLHPAGVVTYLEDCTVAVTVETTPGALTDALQAARRDGGALDQVVLTGSPDCAGAVSALLRAAVSAGATPVGLDVDLVLQAAGGPAGDCAAVLADWQAAGLAALHVRPCPGFEGVLRAAAGLRLPVAAVLPLFAGEDAEVAARRLLAVQATQAETGAVLALIPHQHAAPGDPAPTGYRYLTWVALCRLLLPDVPHVQVSPLTQGARVAQVALGCGGNDFGGTQAQFTAAELTVGRNGPMTAAEIERWIRDAGGNPVRRTATYQHRSVSP